MPQTNTLTLPSTPPQAAAQAAAAPVAARPTPVTNEPSPLATPPAPSSTTVQRPILGVLVADVSKSGFVMTFLAIVALVISAWSLRVTMEQQVEPPAIVPMPYQVDTLVQPHIVKPIYRVYDLPQRDIGSDGLPVCPMIAPTPDLQPSVTTLLTVAS